jgi:hypothetical protein
LLNHTHPDNYVFYLEVETTTTVIKGPQLIDDGINVQFNIAFTHSIKSARCASMEEMHALLDWRFTNGAITTEYNLAHRPGLMRMYFSNKSLPFPLDGYTTPIDIEPAKLLKIPYDPNWLEVLHSRVDMPIPSGGIKVSSFGLPVSDGNSDEM